MKCNRNFENFCQSVKFTLTPIDLPGNKPLPALRGGAYRFFDRPGDPAVRHPCVRHDLPSGDVYGWPMPANLKTTRRTTTLVVPASKKNAGGLSRGDQPVGISAHRLAEKKTMSMYLQYSNHVMSTKTHRSGEGGFAGTVTVTCCDYMACVHNS